MLQGIFATILIACAVGILVSCGGFIAGLPNAEEKQQQLENQLAVNQGYLDAVVELDPRVVDGMYDANSVTLVVVDEWHSMTKPIRLGNAEDLISRARGACSDSVQVYFVTSLGSSKVGGTGAFGAWVID